VDGIDGVGGAADNNLQARRVETTAAMLKKYFREFILMAHSPLMVYGGIVTRTFYRYALLLDDYIRLVVNTTLSAFRSSLDL
jgi:hypothetical protein